MEALEADIQAKIQAAQDAGIEQLHNQALDHASALRAKEAIIACTFDDTLTSIKNFTDHHLYTVFEPGCCNCPGDGDATVNRCTDEHLRAATNNQSGNLFIL